MGPFASVPRERTGSPFRTFPVPGEPRVNQTLVLLNNTLEPGNFLAGNGYSPAESIYDPANQKEYVTDEDSDSVSVISTATDAVVDSIPVGEDPVGIVYDSCQNEIFVANF
ncbi:MAG: hypothetical protein WCA77_02195, partial [Thermoplasmata archaeon]